MNQHTENLKNLIEKAYDNNQLLSVKEYTNAIQETMELLNNGLVRVAEPISPGNW